MAVETIEKAPRSTDHMEPAERETVIRFDDAAPETANVFTAQLEMARRLRDLPGATLVRTEKINGKWYGEEWTLPREAIRP